MGKREIGELSIIDIVVYIMIAELAVVAIEKPQTPMIHSILPMIILMIIQLGLAFLSLRNKKLRDLIEGQPAIIINKGKINEKVMKQQRYNFDDLLLQLREKNIRNIDDVEFAILETSGKLSVFKKDKDEGGITTPLIIDGEIQEKNLEQLNKNIFWLRQQLREQGYKDIKNISFCSFQNGKFFVDDKDTT
jgi:uncharacterized membrane protein YcaP (DUF421 family)